MTFITNLFYYYLPLSYIFHFSLINNPCQNTFSTECTDTLWVGHLIISSSVTFFLKTIIIGITISTTITLRRIVKNISAQSAGFEPARENPIGFQVQRLNHSATAAV